MTSLSAACPGCGFRANVPGGVAGKTLKCPRCGADAGFDLRQVRVGEFAESLELVLGIPILDDDVLAFSVALLAQTPPKCLDPR